MARHILTLEVPKTLNVNILRVLDTSVYAENINIECPILEITLPGFKYRAQFGDDKIKPGFNLSLTACDLEVQSRDCGNLQSGLPDGIYIIKYSVAPNDTVYVEYNHLRVTSLLNRYDKVLCELDLSACSPDSEQEKKMKGLHEIKMYIDSAVAKVEVCHEPDKGMQLYTYAKKLLSKFDCKTC